MASIKKIESLSELRIFLESEEFSKLRIFNEKQTRALVDILDLIHYNIDKINENIEVIMEKLDKLEARFRNHRHETSRNFCGKAEY